MSTSDQFLVWARADDSNNRYYATKNGTFTTFGASLENSPYRNTLRLFPSAEEAESFISKTKETPHKFYGMGVEPVPEKLRKALSAIDSAAQTSHRPEQTNPTRENRR